MTISLCYVSVLHCIALSSVKPSPGNLLKVYVLRTGLRRWRVIWGFSLSWSLLRFQLALFGLCNIFHLASLRPFARISFPLHILLPLSSLQGPPPPITPLNWHRRRCNSNPVTVMGMWVGTRALCSRYGPHCQEETSSQASIFHPDFHRFIGQ